MLSKKQLKLYQNLYTLTMKNETFYFVDQTTPLQTNVRIFLYRIGSFSDWTQPSATECRGIMFEMEDGVPVKVLSRPMEKFFNYAEVKAWEKVKNTPAKIGDVLDVMIKEDGSLVSTFMDKNYLCLKSKGSVSSDQANQATGLLHSLEYTSSYNDVRARLTELVNDGYTANLEYVAPNNRIVIGYEYPKLILLNVRNNETGEYVPYKDLFNDPVLRSILVKRESIDITDLDEFAEYTYNQSGFEGYVVHTTKGFFKIKTNWYVGLHRTKDTLNNNKDLITNILDGSSDDLKQLFATDTVALAKIIAFEDHLISHLNDYIAAAHEYYSSNLDKSRKDFAIGLSKDSEYNLIFNPLMKWYTDRDLSALTQNIIEAMKSNYNKFIPSYYA